MNDLIAWLRAQLDEDERLARAAQIDELVWQSGPGVSYDTQGWVRAVSNDDSWMICETHTRAQSDHIARHDPARVLAEVEAKRAILDLHDSDGGHECVGPADAWGTATIHAQTCPTLRLLAQPYADRHGYREEWRP